MATGNNQAYFIRYQDDVPRAIYFYEDQHLPVQPIDLPGETKFDDATALEIGQKTDDVRRRTHWCLPISRIASLFHSGGSAFPELETLTFGNWPSPLKIEGAEGNLLALGKRLNTRRFPKLKCLKLNLTMSPPLSNGLESFVRALRVPELELSFRSSGSHWPEENVAVLEGVRANPSIAELDLYGGLRCQEILRIRLDTALNSTLKDLWLYLTFPLEEKHQALISGTHLAKVLFRFSVLDKLAIVKKHCLHVAFIEAFLKTMKEERINPMNNESLTKPLQIYVELDAWPISDELKQHAFELIKSWKIGSVSLDLTFGRQYTHSKDFTVFQGQYQFLGTINRIVYDYKLRAPENQRATTLLKILESMNDVECGSYVVELCREFPLLLLQA